MNFIAIQSFIRRSLAAPVFPDSDKTRLADILNRVVLSLTAFWAALVLLLAITRSGYVANLLISLTVLLVLQMLRLIILRGYVYTAAVLLPILLLGVFTFQIYNLGSTHSIHVVGLMMNILLATLLLGRRVGIFFMLASIAAFWGLTEAEAAGLLPQPTQMSNLNLWVNFAGYAIFMIGLVSITRRYMFKALDQATLELEQRRQAEEAVRHLNATLDQHVADRTLALQKEIERHRQTEMKLRLLSQAVEQSPVSVVIAGLNGNIEYVNSKFTEVTGYTAEEAIGNNPRILKSGETSSEAYRQMWDTISSGKEWRGEFHNKKKDGTLYWESASLSPVMDDQGHITHYLAVKEDITQRKQMELMLKQSNESLTALHESSLEFLHQRDFDELMQLLVEHAMVLMNTPFAMIMIVEGEELVVRGRTYHIPFVLGDRYTRETDMPSWHAMDSMEVVVENNFPDSQGPKTGLARPLYAVAVFPIISGSHCLGTLSLGRDLPDTPFTPDQVQVGKLFTQIAALAMENVQLSTEMHELSIRDPLTGLHNRRYLFEVLPREKARALRSGHPISFALIDIDYFKDVNDLYGHGAGDAALCALADLLGSLIRAGDILCRYGGDELIAVMYNTPALVALERANQWRQAAAKLRLEYQDQVLGLTISLGIASFPQHGVTIDEVIGRADHALYQSKNRGRNRATLYGYGASVNLPENVPSDAR